MYYSSSGKTTLSLLALGALVYFEKMKCFAGHCFSNRRPFKWYLQKFEQKLCVSYSCYQSCGDIFQCGGMLMGGYRLLGQLPQWFIYTRLDAKRHQQSPMFNKSINVRFFSGRLNLMITCKYVFVCFVHDEKKPIHYRRNIQKNKRNFINYQQLILLIICHNSFIITDHYHHQQIRNVHVFRK